MDYIKQREVFTDKDSKTVLVLMCLYMSSVLLFTSYVSLNVISQGLFIMAFGCCALYMLFHGKSLRWDGFLICFAAFIVFSFITLAWSENRDATITAILTLIQLFILSMILHSYISAYENIDSFVKALLIAGLLCSMLIIGYYGIGEYIRLMLEGQRLGSEITNVNTIGLYTSTTMIICFYYGYMRNKRLAYIVMLLPTLVAFGSGSRKALAMMALGILLIVFMKYRENINLKSFFRLLIVILVLILLINWLSTLPIFQGAFDRFRRMIGDDNIRDNSTKLRAKMVEAGLDYFKQHPYTGVGLGNSRIITKARFNFETYLHNNFIELLATVGVFGFIIYYSIYVYLIVNLYLVAVRSGDDMAVLMMTLILTHFVLGYGFVSYNDKMTYIYFSMASATIAIGKRKIAEQELLEDEYGDECIE